MNPNPEALFWGVFTVVVAVIVITRILIHRQHKRDKIKFTFSGELPKGMHLSEDGEISGTPEEPGSGTFNIYYGRRKYRDRPMASERLPRGERRNVSN